jgi:hypothetical protein
MFGRSAARRTLMRDIMSASTFDGGAIASDLWCGRIFKLGEASTATDGYSGVCAWRAMLLGPLGVLRCMANFAQASLLFTQQRVAPPRGATVSRR